MGSTKPPHPPDQAPWDPLNGFRVGVVVGALLAAGFMWLFGPMSFWVVATGAVIGGAIGYWSQKRQMP